MDEVKKFFNESVFGFMFADIQREIELARENKNAGNVLAALGLLCFTEALGYWVPDEEREKRKDYLIELYQKEGKKGETPSKSRIAFECFYARMGGWYASHLKEKEMQMENDEIFRKPAWNFYNDLRCGLAHEFEPRRPLNIIMLGQQGEKNGADQQFVLAIALSKLGAKK